MTRYTYDEIRNYQIRAERAEKRLGEAVTLLFWASRMTPPTDIADRIWAFRKKIDAECEPGPSGSLRDRVASRKCDAVCPLCKWRCPEPAGHPLSECFRCDCYKLRNP